VEIERKGKTIYLKNKELNALDKLVLDFVSLIKFDYVIISGYVAILFGRSRTTEDVDLFINPRNKQELFDFFDSLKTKDFSIMNAENNEDAYELLREGSSLRIIFHGNIFPNFELKFPKETLGELALINKIKVAFDHGIINTSELESQIAYKLFLGSDKDLDDAAHLYRVLKEYLNPEELKYYIKAMKIKKSVVRESLGEDLET